METFDMSKDDLYTGSFLQQISFDNKLIIILIIDYTHYNLWKLYTDFSWESSFEANILPYIHTSVVESVIGCIEEEGVAPLSESDYEIVDVSYERDEVYKDDGNHGWGNKHSTDCRCCGGTKECLVETQDSLQTEAREA